MDRGTHQGGTADCLAPALCEVCQHSYGELGLHHFVDQVNEYRLKSAATCTSPAVYYQSCSTCGAQGTETFTNGEPLGHDYGAWASNEDGTHTRICAHDAAHTETENCHGGTATCTHKAVCTVCGGEYGEMAAHSFTAEKAEAQYLKSAATCTEKAIYYKSCAVCGLSSKGTADEATFFSGNALDHDWGAWTQNSDEKTHTRICKRDTSHTETENCHGGTADCTHKAVCTVCGGEYGELDPKNHTNLKHFPAVAATKTAEGNIEYWYCSGCKKYYKDATATQEIKQADTVTAKLPGGTVKPGADKSPQTGDNSNLLLWIALLFVSGGAAIGTTIVSRKKKYNR